MGRRNKINVKLKPFFIIMACLFMIIYSFVFVDRQVRPTVEALSEVQARIIGTRAINDGVSEVLENGIGYNELINILRDQQGNISLLQANTVAINTMATKITRSVQEKMEVVSNKLLRIPLGNILGSQVLANYGPKLDIEITPAGSVLVDFFTEFEQAGINQTIHRIYIKVETKVQIIIPLSSKSVDIITNVPIAETVIVGKVPDTYIDVPDVESKDYLNLIPME